MSGSHHHGHAHADHGVAITDPEFIELNKRFYLDEEEYDWVEVTDRISGLESFHYNRPFPARLCETRGGLFFAGR